MKEMWKCILLYNQWVRVCDDGWDDSEADVVFRQLGFGSSVRIQNFRGSGSKRVMIPNFSCSGNELMLLNCSHGGIRLSDCDLYEESKSRWFVMLQCQVAMYVCMHLRMHVRMYCMYVYNSY